MKSANHDARKENGVAAILKRKLQHPTFFEIQKRAYEIYLARGCVPGHDKDDWFQAERELKAQMAPSPAEEPAGQEKVPTGFAPVDRVS